MSGVAVWKHVTAMLCHDASSNYFRGAQDAAMRYRPPKRRTQGDDGSYVRGPLRGDRAGDDSSQAMADEMDPATRFSERPFDSLHSIDA